MTYKELLNVANQRAYPIFNKTLDKLQSLDPQGHKFILQIIKELEGKLSDEYFYVVENLWEYTCEKLDSDDFFAIKYFALVLYAQVIGEISGKGLLQSLIEADKIKDVQGASESLKYLKGLIKK